MSSWSGRNGDRIVEVAVVRLTAGSTDKYVTHETSNRLTPGLLSGAGPERTSFRRLRVEGAVRTYHDHVTGRQTWAGVSAGAPIIEHMFEMKRHAFRLARGGDTLWAGPDRHVVFHMGKGWSGRWITPAR